MTRSIKQLCCAATLLLPALAGSQEFPFLTAAQNGLRLSIPYLEYNGGVSKQGFRVALTTSDGGLFRLEPSSVGSVSPVTPAVNAATIAEVNGTFTLNIPYLEYAGGGLTRAFQAALRSTDLSVFRLDPASVIEVAVEESPYVKDDPTVYAVEEARVLSATVVTVDGTYTFADVNADTDDSDAIVPEVAAHFIVDGYPDDGKATNATLRLRGHSSRLAAQKSYRIKLANDAAAWRNEKTLQFNKHPYDLTRIRNKLAFDLFRDIPHMPSLRTQFVRIGITNKNANGISYATGDFGLFTHVEKMGKEYLSKRGLPTDGNIYKAEDFDFRLSTNLALDSNGKPLSKTEFEKVLSLEADNGNHEKLIAMINAVNDSGTDFDTVFTQYFDRNNYLTWLATNILMGNRDTINQNFALYQPKANDKFYFLPWDYDGAFGFEDQPSQRAAGPLYAAHQQTVANWWGVPLHQRFLSNPQHRAELVAMVHELAQRYLTEAKIKAKIDAYRPLVEPWITTSPDLNHLPLVSNTASSEWDAECTRIAKVIQTNLTNFTRTLENPMPFWQSAASQGNQIRFSWGQSVDLQGDPVRYTAMLSATPDFSNVRMQSDLTENQWLVPMLPDGNWYLKVLATDSKGNTQAAFDITESANTRYFGVLAFVVRAGQIVQQ